MQTIVIAYPKELDDYRLLYIAELKNALEKANFTIIVVQNYHHLLDCVISNTRLMCLVVDWEYCEFSLLSKLSNYKPKLPIIALSNQRQDIELNLKDLQLNLDFLQFDTALYNHGLQRILQRITEYRHDILPPFTRKLVDFVRKNDYSFSTPGHQAGLGFQKSPVGTLFYDFYGPNIFKSDISISMPELGSLLDHTGPHKDAEEYIAQTFNADRSLIVTNGTSTSNKIIGMYVAGDGDTVLVDRNCHKSIAQFLSMMDVHPIYLKPMRNTYGIIGGIPESEFSDDAIQKKLDEHPTASNWPVYAVITNSTYDGIFYNTDKIKSKLNVKHIHFDGAWVPYAHFHPIYHGKYGMCGDAPQGKTIFETQSTHKLLAAFSQASLIHIKGNYDHTELNEAYMMHTSTSPFYPMVASCEISAAMMQGKTGYHIINDTIECAVDFRREIARLITESDSWFYQVWQPQHFDIIDAWPLKSDDAWHGFPIIDQNHLFLDPIKVTLLLPGIANGKPEKTGIPAAVVAAFLEDHGIVVEKTGPYSMLFLFSLGITRAKTMRLLKMLNEFKQMYDDNLPVKEVLPSIYAIRPVFYANMLVQTLAQKLHNLMSEHQLNEVMYHAYDNLPEIVMTPHQAYQHIVHRKIKTISLNDFLGHTSAAMILPYPPGIPLIMPGERLTEKSKAILTFLQILEKIGSECHGFETDIHGLERGKNGELMIRVIDE